MNVVVFRFGLNKSIGRIKILFERSSKEDVIGLHFTTNSIAQM